MHNTDPNEKFIAPEQSNVNHSQSTEKVPNNVKPTITLEEFVLATLCLSWHFQHLRGYEKVYESIANLIPLNKLKDILKNYENVLKGNDEGKKLLDKLKGIQPTILSGCITIISDLTANKKIIPHYFQTARNIKSNFRLYVKLHELSIEHIGLDEFDYETLKEIYHAEDGKFEVSNAVKSLLTDTVLSVYANVEPNLGMPSSGTKSAFAEIIDMGELEYRTPDGDYRKLKDIHNEYNFTMSEGYARRAITALKNQQYFKKLYLNDADRRFYNYMRCIKEQPLLVIMWIIILNNDEKLNTLRQAAKAEAEAREKAKKTRYH